MKILLVYPNYPNTFWSFKHSLKFIGKKAAIPPLGLITVASLLPKEWKKKLIDMNVEKLKEKHIQEADIVFISAMIVQKESSKKIITLCKKHNTKVVAGGPLFTTGYDDFPEVDHLVLNEAENTLPKFLEDLEKGEAKQRYTSNERPDITKTPIPQWNLIKMNKYASMCVQYSRGCPFNCEFCDIIIMNGRIPRVKSAKQMIAEFQALKDAGWRGSVFVVDDNFIGNKHHVKKDLLPALIRWQRKNKYPFTLITEASTNMADDERLLNMMVGANFNSVFLGIETPDTDCLKETGKFQNVNRDLTETVSIIQRKGIEVTGGFIVGFDNDKENIFQRQLEFIQKTGIVIAMVGILTAAPKTRLWNRLKKEGRLIENSTGNNTDAHLNFIPKMNSELLLQEYKKLVAKIYNPKKYYERIYTYLKQHTPQNKRKIKFSEVRGFLRSIWRIGIFSRQQKLYWKLVIYSMFKKGKLPVAIRLIIYGFHLQKVAKKC